MTSERPYLRDQVAAVVVLYGTAPFESQTLESLALASAGRRVDQVRLFVWDNSPAPLAQIPDGLAIAQYVSCSANLGLAAAYNTALEWASAAHVPWLVLLDQDTRVTKEYLEAVRAFVAKHPEGAADDGKAIGLGYPTLQQGNSILSPLAFPTIRARPHTTSDGTGNTKIMVLNSGAVVAVRAADAVGGFPRRYPLDGLDHAFVSELRLAGYGITSLGATLEHHASTSVMHEMPVSRLNSINEAEERYFLEYGSLSDRLWLLVRRALRLAQVGLGFRDSPSIRAEITALRRSVTSLARERRVR